MKSLIIETMIRARDVTLDSSSRFPIARWAPLPLRLIVGFGFMQHGFSKLSRGSDAFVAILHALGVPAPHFMALFTILIEILGGLAVMLGAFVTLVSLPMAALLLVAIFTVHLPYGFSSIKLMAVLLPARNSDRWAMSVTSSILPASRPLLWVVLAHWR
jgi:uncharacterized membrane protein YphA (DoxX/SURF4 family)